MTGEQYLEQERAMLKQIEAVCGPHSWLSPEDASQRILNMRGEKFASVVLLRPANTQEVSFMVKTLASSGYSVIPVGGASGLVDGLKATAEKQWYLSLERMRSIERVDDVSRLAVVQSGVILEQLQQAAAQKNQLFAVDLGARGSATIGGLISTNAGGERVLRFGMMREQVLGLEVVLADGTILDLMSEVVKNNSGYDLKQIFIGSEGTLGIVTRAVLRLRSSFISHDAAWLAISDPAHIPTILSQLERELTGALSAFELMWPEFVSSMCQGELAKHKCPVQMDGVCGHILIESEGGHPESDKARLESALEKLLERDMIVDAAFAQSESERKAMWAIRNDIPRLVQAFYPPVAFDISIPIAAMYSYAEKLRTKLCKKWETARLCFFGHVADNNLHIMVTTGATTMDNYSEIASIVYEDIQSLRGAISAEHGIGVEKRSALQTSLPPQVIAGMRMLKQTFDPNGVLNPGKVLY